MKSSILFYSWSLTLLDTVLFMNPLNFVAVILKVLLVNLLAALNFANFFKNKKTFGKKRKKRDQE